MFEANVLNYRDVLQEQYRIRKYLCIYKSVLFPNLDKWIEVYVFIMLLILLLANLNYRVEYTAGWYTHVRHWSI